MSKRSKGLRAEMERQWYPDEELRRLRAAFHRKVLRGDFDPYLLDRIAHRKFELSREAA